MVPDRVANRTATGRGYWREKKDFVLMKMKMERGMSVTRIFGKLLSLRRVGEGFFLEGQG